MVSLSGKVAARFKLYSARFPSMGLYTPFSVCLCIHLFVIVSIINIILSIITIVNFITIIINVIIVILVVLLFILIIIK